MTINGVQGGIGNMSRGVRRHNRSLSRGEWKDCPGGWGKTEACPGGIYKSVPRYNISLSREIVPGYAFAIIVICRGVRLNNGIAQLPTRCNCLNSTVKCSFTPSVPTPYYVSLY